MSQFLADALLMFGFLLGLVLVIFWMTGTEPAPWEDDSSRDREEDER